MTERLEQPLNACSRMDRGEVGKFTYTNHEHARKAELSMLSMVLGSVIFRKKNEKGAFHQSE